MRKVRFGKVIQGGGDFLYIQWAYFEGYEAPEVRIFNLRTYGLLPCHFLNESKRVRKRVSKHDLSHTKPIHTNVIRQYFEENMAKEVYHIRYNTKKERKQLIHKVQYLGKEGIVSMEAFGTDVTASYSLYQMFEHVSELQEKDPFRFMVLVHNAVFDTVEITDKKIVKSVDTYSYDDLAKRYTSALKGI